MKKILILLAIIAWCQPLCAQKTDYPLIGAQVFIEPGQSGQDIDDFFRILQENHMEVARIRMFGAHMLSSDGTWNFKLYDQAFDAAQRHGVKLFATLFPPTDPLSDVGGFKFPRSKAHLNEIAQYIQAVVSHFEGHPALYTWVLQNEPGSNGISPAKSDLTEEIHAQWMAQQKPSAYDNGFLKADFSAEHFHTYLTSWYLRWISSQVQRYDKVHYRHINPHQLFDNLPDYDFKAYEEFLTSLGVSMHLSWHFGYFTRSQYPLGISLMADVIRSGAGHNPFWITEMQGGNVTASGKEMLCPTAEEITQWLWTGVSTGAEGVIFWTLNQRASVMEAGEWGMLDFQRQPSDRLTSAAQVAKTISSNKAFFAKAQPLKSNITLLYNMESLLTQKKNAATSHDPNHEGRMSSATMKSLAGAYEAITAWGVIPEVCEMRSYHWNPADGSTVVLPNLISLPSDCWAKLDQFVKQGGRLIVTGQTGFYDENMSCILMGNFPLRNCFGAQISEYKVVAPYFTMACSQPSTPMPVHLWKGILRPDKANAIAVDGKEVVASHHNYGKGEVIWFPSLIELGGWQHDNCGVVAFYGNWCRSAIDRSPLRFAKPLRDVLMRQMETPNQRLAVLINKQPQAVEVELAGQLPTSARKLCGQADIKSGKVRLDAGECVVYLWNKIGE